MARTEITWEIEQLKYAKVSGELENVILEANYKLIAWYDMTIPDETDNLDENNMIIDPTKTTVIENGVTVHGMVELDPPGDTFTPLDSLAKGDVVQWIKTKLGPTQVQLLETEVTKKRSNLIDDNIARGRPAHWDPIV